MSKVGIYEEDLPTGGKLIIEKKSWKLFYYFAGPDLRHNGSFVTIPSGRVDEYIKAFKENWIEYETLKKSIPKNGSFEKEGALNMYIRIGGFAQGVCIHSYHMPISRERQLNELIDSYIYAKGRAEEVQKFLLKLDTTDV